MITVHPVRGLPEIARGDDLASLVAAAVELADGDVVVVSQKVVSKSEGAVAMPEPGEDRAQARSRIARSRARRVVADDGVLIVETAQGMVCANAGIDTSNVPGGALTLLPEDADRSARSLRAALESRTGARIGVVVADTFGRPWRMGLTDVAIGVAGLPPLRDERGGVDNLGQALAVTEVAVADEVAAAADLVRRKADAVPVVIVRGLDWAADPGASVASLVRTGAHDLFPRGRGMLADHLAGRASAADLTGPVPEAAWERAAAAARHSGGPEVVVARDREGLALTGEPVAVGVGAGAAVAALVDLGHGAAWRHGEAGSVLVRPAEPTRPEPERSAGGHR